MIMIITVSVFVMSYLVSAEKPNKGSGLCTVKNSSLFQDLDLLNTFMDPIADMVEERTCKCVDDAIKSVKTELQKMKWSKRTMKSCLDWHKAGKTVDGIYKIYPDGKTLAKVYCDMKNGGWTIIQRRVNGKVSFDRVWREYVKGFGDLNKDHWLGLKNIHLLTKHPNKISFELLMKSGNIAKATYGAFQVEDENTHFRMHVSGSGTYNPEMMKYVDAGTLGFFFHDGMMFTTKDADHDLHSNNCANYNNGGGWWYKNCYRIGALNAKFGNLYIYANGKLYLLSKSEVKIIESTCN